jgi:fructose/tagatose bisphosphate aldolase
MEIGITGGEEDGVDNTAVKAEALYTKPEQVRACGAPRLCHLFTSPA